MADRQAGNLLPGLHAVTLASLVAPSEARYVRPCPFLQQASIREHADSLPLSAFGAWTTSLATASRLPTATTAWAF